MEGALQGKPGDRLKAVLALISCGGRIFDHVRLICPLASPTQATHYCMFLFSDVIVPGNTSCAWGQASLSPNFPVSSPHPKHLPPSPPSPNLTRKTPTHKLNCFYSCPSTTVFNIQGIHNCVSITTYTIYYTKTAFNIQFRDVSCVAHEIRSRENKKISLSNFVIRYRTVIMTQFSMTSPLPGRASGTCFNKHFNFI